MTHNRDKSQWRKVGRRQEYRVMAPERHLVICEGEKAELYFVGIRDALKPEFRNRIRVVIKDAGLHINDLFDYALRECRLSGGYNHVWLACDEDYCDPQDFDSAVCKCSECSDETTKFHLLRSNSCTGKLETWYGDQGNSRSLEMKFGASFPDITIMLAEYIKEG